MDLTSLHTILLKHEGLRLKPYVDTTGNLTIGIGRNLDGSGISIDEAYTLLDHDLARCELELIQYPWYSILDDIRKGVLIELDFNIGLSKLLAFKNMLDSLKNHDYENAAKELLDSTWATQVGKDRSTNMAMRLQTGKMSY